MGWIRFQHGFPSHTTPTLTLVNFVPFLLLPFGVCVTALPQFRRIPGKLV